MKVTIYHNPKCGTSRGALALIRTMQVPVRDVVRWKEPLAAELGLDGKDDDTLLEAMATHPILMNRPIVVTPRGAKLCRPSEVTVGLLQW